MSAGRLVWALENDFFSCQTLVELSSRMFWKSSKARGRMRLNQRSEDGFTHRVHYDS